MASFFRRITENWKLKTLALAIAALLWVVWSADAVRTNWIPVPLQVQVGDSRYRAVTTTSQDIEVRFTGPGGDLLDIAVRRPPLRLTIDEVNAPTSEYALDPRMIQLPAQLAVSALEVRPASVTLEFIRVDSRVVPVRPQVIDALGPDWVLVDSVVVDPPQVRLSGPIARVAAVTEIPTQPFELTASDTLIRRTVALDTTGISDLEPGVQTVNLTARVDRIVDRTISNVRVDVGGGMAVTPATVAVQLRGPQRIVRMISPGSFRVVVAIDELPARFPEGGLPVPLRVEGIRSDIQASVVPSRATLVPLPAPTDDLQDSVSTPPAGAAGDSIPSVDREPGAAGTPPRAADGAGDVSAGGV